MKIINIASARPNFMKVAPLLKEYKKHQGIEARLLYTGQHYDYGMLFAPVVCLYVVRSNTAQRI
jgi:UDP-N-acetylglucosamine 2-epimerase